MIAIILAAGRGVRMGKLTDNAPKPLLKVKGVALIEHNLNQLAGLVKECIIVVGYKKEKIIGFIGNNYKGISITYVIQKEQLGTGDALKSVYEYDKRILKKPFILLMGDDLYFRSDIVNCLKYKDAILAKEVDDPSRFGVFIVENGLIMDVIEKPKKPVSNIANAALYVLNGIEIKGMGISKRGEIEFTDLVKKIAKERDVHCVLADRWIPIAYPEDLKTAESMI